MSRGRRLVTTSAVIACTTTDRVQLAGRLAALVARLHQHGIIHGLIKPTNVIVIESNDGPFPVLLDVGVVPAIEFGAGKPGTATPLRDEQGLHAVLAGMLGDLGSMVAGSESAAALAEMFVRPAG